MNQVQQPEREQARSLGMVNSVILLIVGTLFFAIAWTGVRPLTMHEARLPQTSLEMWQQGHWLVPTSGGRPWVERPPLPHWIMMAVHAATGQTRQLWTVRLAPTLMGLVCVLLTGWIGARLYNRQVGLLAGLMLSCSYEFINYAWLAEDDIFLCAVITALLALFTHLSVHGDPEPHSQHRNWSLAGPRPCLLVIFFIMLGATNLIKGMAFGTIIALLPMLVFLLWQRDWRSLGFYTWLWGGLLFVMTAAWWPMIAEWYYPNAMHIWLFDLFGRVDGSYAPMARPWYYYLEKLPGETAPWTPLAFIGIWAGLNRKSGLSPVSSRFVLCWALAVPLLLSFSTAKHHHYLLHVIGGWSILSALGATWCWHRLIALPRRLLFPPLGALIWGGLGFAGLYYFAPYIQARGLLILSMGLLITVVAGACYMGLWHRRPAVTMIALLIGLWGGYAYLYTCEFPITDETLHDRWFARHVAEHYNDLPIVINGDLGTMDFFRLQFDLPEDTILIHNQSYLWTTAVPYQRFYLIDRLCFAPVLAERFGHSRLICHSQHTRRQYDPGARLALFLIERDPEIPLVAPPPIDPVNAMGRNYGPFVPDPHQSPGYYLFQAPRTSAPSD